MSTDTREALAALMVIAAECAQRKPLRGFEELTEAIHIGHRQFGRAHEKADEDVRMLAVRLRAVFDTLAAALATQPAQPAQLEAMVDKAWSRFEAEDQRLKSKKSERVRALVNAGSFPGMSEAFDAHMGAECWTDPAYQPDASTWAAAWKAAKRDSAAQPSAQGEAVAWRCFHCDAEFNGRAEAELHFGPSEHSHPACQINIEHVRWLEDQHRRNIDDDTEALRTIRGLAGEHETLRRRAEEQGYARGLADAQKHPQELGLVLASAPAEPTESLAWLVEWKAHGYGPQWWGFTHTPRQRGTWCSDAKDAIRFARKEDAERMRLHIIAVDGLTGVHDYERSVSVTEHMWEDPSRAE